MSAATEQYRVRLGETGWEGSRAHRRATGETVDWSALDSGMQEHLIAIAEAVAVRVLRDVLRFFDGDPIAQEGLQEFAADRGITLGETR